MNARFKLDDRLTPELEKLGAELRDTRPIMAACGKTMEVDLRRHFAERDSEGNVNGWPRKHFWARQVRDRVALTTVTESTAAVTVDSPELAHKITGGTIRPKRGKTLALPANGEAYKAGSPREANIDQLDYLPLNQGNLVGALIRRFRTVLKKTKKGFKSGGEVGGDVWYWLVRSVKQDADPRALPAEDEMFEHVVETARTRLQRMIRRGK